MMSNGHVALSRHRYIAVRMQKPQVASKYDAFKASLSVKHARNTHGIFVQRFQLLEKKRGKGRHATSGSCHSKNAATKRHLVGKSCVRENSSCSVSNLTDRPQRQRLALSLRQIVRAIPERKLQRGI
ncbi:unnamed protein product [Ixodes pacificus]